MIISHKSLIAYLTSVKLTATAAALRQELSIGDTFDDATSKKYEGLLEKKWTSVIRLQKKVYLSAIPIMAQAEAGARLDNGSRVPQCNPSIRT